MIRDVVLKQSWVGGGWQASVLFQRSSNHLSEWQGIDAQPLLWSDLENGLIGSSGILEPCLKSAEIVNKQNDSCQTARKLQLQPSGPEVRDVESGLFFL